MMLTMQTTQDQRDLKRITIPVMVRAPRCAAPAPAARNGGNIISGTATPRFEEKMTTVLLVYQQLAMQNERRFGGPISAALEEARFTSPNIGPADFTGSSLDRGDSSARNQPRTHGHCRPRRSNQGRSCKGGPWGGQQPRSR